MLLLALAITVVSVPSLAQEPGKFEVSGGAAFVGNTDIVDGYGPGWVVGSGWYAKRWLAVEIEMVPEVGLEPTRGVNLTGF